MWFNTTGNKLVGYCANNLWNPFSQYDEYTIINIFYLRYYNIHIYTISAVDNCAEPN